MSGVDWTGLKDADGNPAVFTGEFVSAGYAIRNLTVKASNRVGGIAAATAPGKILRPFRFAGRRAVREHHAGKRDA